MQALYKRYGVNPMAGFFPIFIQFPLIIGVYDAIQRLLIAGKYIMPTQVTIQGMLNLTGTTGNVSKCTLTIMSIMIFCNGYDPSWSS